MIKESYGFGEPTGGESTGGSEGTPKPPGVSGAADLTAANAGTSWNAAASHTPGTWDFGSDAQTPALNNADYDGSGDAFNCDRLPTDSGDPLLSGQRSGESGGDGGGSLGAGSPSASPVRRAAALVCSVRCAAGKGILPPPPPRRAGLPPRAGGRSAGRALAAASLEGAPFNAQVCFGQDPCDDMQDRFRDLENSGLPAPFCRRSRLRPALRPGRGLLAQTTTADSNGNGLIESTSLGQLNALRHERRAMPRAIPRWRLEVLTVPAAWWAGRKAVQSRRATPRVRPMVGMDIMTLSAGWWAGRLTPPIACSPLSIRAWVRAARPSRWASKRSEPPAATKKDAMKVAAMPAPAPWTHERRFSFCLPCSAGGGGARLFGPLRRWKWRPGPRIAGRFKTSGFLFFMQMCKKDPQQQNHVVPS